MRIAVVYYTRFGHNTVIAETMARELGAELRRIETPKQHGYQYMGFASTFNIRMKIAAMDFDLSAFDLVVLCTPIWAWKPAAPTRTFLREARLPARLAVCFSTGGGPTLRAQEKLKQDITGRQVEVVAFGEISTDKADDDALREAARRFAGRLPK